MTQERCRLLFATSFDVRLVDSVNTDGSTIRLLKDSLLPYASMCDLFCLPGTLIGLNWHQQSNMFPQRFFTDLAFGIFPTPLCCLLYTSPSPRDGLLSRMPS